MALLWNGAAIKEETYGITSNPKIKVGEEQDNDFIVVSDQISDDFDMFERTSDGYVFRFTDKMLGDFTRNGRDAALADFRANASSGGSVSTAGGSANVYELPLQVGDRGLVNISDENQIYFDVFDRAPIAPRRGLLSSATDAANFALTLLIIASALAHLLFVLAAMLAYDPEAELNPLFAQNRFAQFVVNDINDPEEEEEVEEPEEDTTGKKAGGDEGKFGADDSEIEESKIPKVDGEMVDEIDVKNIGVNKALGSKLLGGGPLKSIFGNQEGFDASMNVAMSGEGGELVVGRGAGGMGLRGTGRGGGGEGLGRIGGLGKVDTGGGKGKGGAIGRKKKAKVKTKVRTGSPKIGDFCEKSNIQRVVRAKTNAVKYCFEKQLQSNPKLSGKIVASWNVGLDGSVIKASIASSTMNSKPVEGCITRVIKRMRFQKPKGGICIINYPFIFSGLE